MIDFQPIGDPHLYRYRRLQQAAARPRASPWYLIHNLLADYHGYKGIIVNHSLYPLGIDIIPDCMHVISNRLDEI